MKIGISSTGTGMDSMLDARFGRCSCFAVVDTGSGSAEYIDNTARTASGGAGTAAAQAMIDAEVDAVVTGNMGPNAFNVMANSDIKVYRCGNVSLQTALDLFKDAKLQEITQAGPAHAGMRR